MANEIIQNNYSDDNIRTLEGVEHIRLRPGMYIGTLGNGDDPADGIYVLLKEVVLPKLNAGDFIKFKGVGAYTICLTPTFINFLAPILTIENSEYKEVRRRQSVDDILTIYKV